MHLIGKRVALARGSTTLSQEGLAEALGFKDRQTISAIETGQRKVTADELALLAEKLHQSVDYFTDPYVVVERSQFSYRANERASDALQDFGHKAERLISVQRRFRELLGEVGSPIQPQLASITKKTSLEAAASAGEQLGASWALGDIPTTQLRDSAEGKLGISILFVDGQADVSGAACYLDDGSVVLINRNEAPGRLNFTLGHEIFHILTWKEMHPEPMDLEVDPGRPRPYPEKLADSFTSGLLMPTSAIESRWNSKGDEKAEGWIRRHAKELLVSNEALYWRLINLKLIQKDEALYKALRKNGQTQAIQRPRLYSKDFVTRLHNVLDKGHITALRAAQLLDTDLEDLAELLKSYDLSVPFPR